MINLILDKKGGINKGDIDIFETENKNEVYVIQLTKQGQPYNLTGKTVELSIIEKKRKYGDMLQLQVEDAVTGKVRLEIVSDITKQDGAYDFQLTVKGADGFTELFPVFRVDIKNNISTDLAGTIVSSPSFTILNDKLEKVTEWDAYFAETSGKLEEKYTTRLNEINTSLENIASIGYMNKRTNIKYFSPIFWQEEATYYNTNIFNWNVDFVKNKITKYKNIGFNAITLQPCVWITDSNIVRNYSGIEEIIDYTKSLNLKVVVRLHMRNGNSNKTKTTQLYNNMKQYINEMALMCKNKNVEVFFLGTEETNGSHFEFDNNTMMTEIVNNVRSIYQGHISYGGTKEEVFNWEWLKLLDSVGVDLYPKTIYNVKADLTEIINSYYINNTVNINGSYFSVDGYISYLADKYMLPVYICEWNIPYGYITNGGFNILSDNEYSLDIDERQASGMNGNLSYQFTNNSVIGSNCWCDIVNQQIGDYSWDDGNFLGRTKQENVIKKWGDLIV